MLVIFKPPDMLSQKADSESWSVNEYFAQYLKFKYQKPGKVFCAATHRLDRMASGFLILAKTSKCAQRITLQINQDQLQKSYWTITRKTLSQDNITLRGHFSKRNLKAVADAQGNEYLLHAKLLKEHNELFAYDVEIEGGKFHQIRALFAASGSPIAGDTKYGGEPLRKDTHRIGLICHTIRFKHPTRNEILSFELPQLFLTKCLESYFV